jgi:hypothetical protein
LLLNVLPARWFRWTFGAIQGLLLAVLICGLPFFDKLARADLLPALWFAAMHQTAAGRGGPAEAAALADAVRVLGAVSASAVASYVLAYRRYQVLLLESPYRARGSRWPARLLELLLRQGPEQAVFAFSGKSLVRSATHRMVLTVYAGVSVFLVFSGLVALLGVDLANLRPGRARFVMATVTSAPLLLSLIVIGGLRYLFSLPVEPRANWVFRTLRHLGPILWMRGIDRFVQLFGVLPAVTLTFPFSVALLGWVAALKIALLAWLFASLVYEAMFWGWSKVPFTCTYLPGRSPVWQTGLQYGAVFVFVLIIGGFFSACLNNTALLVATAAVLGGLNVHLRLRRIRSWPDVTFKFEEQMEPAVQILGLQPD